MTTINITVNKDGGITFDNCDLRWLIGSKVVKPGDVVEFKANHGENPWTVNIRDPFDVRRECAERVLTDLDARRATFHQVGDGVTVCVYKDRHTGRVHLGSSVCDPSERYDIAIGRALAFERAQGFPEDHPTIKRLKGF